MFFHEGPSARPEGGGRVRISGTGVFVRLLLHLMAANFNMRKSLKIELGGLDGPLDFTVGIETDSGSVSSAIRFRGGRARVLSGVPADADGRLCFTSDAAVRRFLAGTSTDQVYMVLKNDLTMKGNASILNLFIYFVSILLHRQQIRKMAKERRADQKRLASASPGAPADAPAPRRERLKGQKTDPGVKFLDDPYLSEYRLDDFPRVKAFLARHFSERAEVCPELPLLVTRWHRENGFETKKDGTPWNPILRKAECYKHLMEHKLPRINQNDLIAGATTSKDIGVVVYPEGHGTMIWGELLTVPHRSLNPYDVSPETRRALHDEVFPYWVHRNFKEWVREKFGNPLCQQIDERFAVYFDWKSVTISHTIPDFPKLLKKGAAGIMAEVREAMEQDPDPDRNVTREAMLLCLEGLVAFSRNLSREAGAQALSEKDPVRRAELLRLSEICARVPEHPARSLDEAVNAIWITFVALHMESTNAGLSLGRLDQWLQPYLESDMAALADETERRDTIRRAIELIGCLMMRATDHLPLTPDFANFYFGGSSSDQAITLGGVTPEGGDGVNDMTYIFLKVTEMLAIRDPNVNARYNPEMNSDAYLKRLCEVNLLTTATPSMHNDKAIWAALAEFGYAEEDLRNWSATGCVEPTLSGRHIGHTNFQMINMVAALEMAMHNGLHPLMGWKLGPDTGLVENGDFASFDEFFEAFKKQFAFLIDQSIRYNEMLAQAHQELRPTPMLSCLIEDCITKGRDVTRGGARYNSSGAACIGLADVTDSLLAIKKLVYDEKKLTFAELKAAVDANFEGHPAILALVRNKVPLFGSGSPEAVQMADRVASFAHDTYGSYVNYRGGRYTTGFWSMSNHVAYGTLSGALPSGKLAGKPFTPGLTPQPAASPSLLDNLRDVAALNPRNMNNNIAFNVKVVPHPGDGHEKTVETMMQYVKTYFLLGGMQMQMNTVTSKTLRDAMAHPELYRHLLVRISGYNAYFTTLNRDMQQELIDRAEYGL